MCPLAAPFSPPNLPGLGHEQVAWPNGQVGSPHRPGRGVGRSWRADYRGGGVAITKNEKKWIGVHFLLANG
jgi:hypothetical protein